MVAPYEGAEEVEAVPVVEQERVVVLPAVEVDANHRAMLGLLQLVLQLLLVTMR